MRLIQRYKSWSWKSIIFLILERKVSQWLTFSPINIGTTYLKKRSMLMDFMVKTNKSSILIVWSSCICPQIERFILLEPASGEVERLHLLTCPSLFPWIYNSWWAFYVPLILFFHGIILSLVWTSRQNILLEEPEASLNFSNWEQLDYDLELRMMLSAYKEEIRSSQASFRKIQRLNTHMPFMLWS